MTPNRIAGLTIANGQACLVVLGKDGEAWRVESAKTYPLPLLLEAWRAPPFPVVLDAAAWWSNTAMPRNQSDADRFLAAGWDVRPPLWLNNKAPANPPDFEMLRAANECGAEPERAFETVALSDAFLLACWGATHDTHATRTAPAQAARSGAEAGNGTPEERAGNVGDLGAPAVSALDSWRAAIRGADDESPIIALDESTDAFISRVKKRIAAGALPPSDPVALDREATRTDPTILRRMLDQIADECAEHRRRLGDANCEREEVLAEAFGEAKRWKEGTAK